MKSGTTRCGFSAYLLILFFAGVGKMTHYGLWGFPRSIVRSLSRGSHLYCYLIVQSEEATSFAKSVFEFVSVDATRPRLGLGRVPAGINRFTSTTPLASHPLAASDTFPRRAYSRLCRPTKLILDRQNTSRSVRRVPHLSGVITSSFPSRPDPGRKLTHIGIRGACTNLHYQPCSAEHRNLLALHLVPEAFNQRASVKRPASAPPFPPSRRRLFM